jgi:DNA-binding GntR family transcriptional regulator
MVTVTDGQVSRVSLAEAIRLRLREQILSGALAMGQRLTEQHVAKQMGTSAGPVREAFASLTYEGLLISLPNRGTFVSSVSEEEARGAYAVRWRVESYAFELARERLTEAANTELDALVVGLKRAAAESNYAEMIGMDMRFHGIFYAHSGNPILVALWPLLEGTIRKFITVAGPHYTRDLIDLAKRHEELLENVRRGDMKSVARELARHGQDIWEHLSPDRKAAIRPAGTNKGSGTKGRSPSKLRR